VANDSYKINAFEHMDNIYLKRMSLIWDNNFLFGVYVVNNLWNYR